jgi:hypothetical protein
MITSGEYIHKYHKFAYVVGNLKDVSIKARLLTTCHMPKNQNYPFVHTFYLNCMVVT